MEAPDTIVLQLRKWSHCPPYPNPLFSLLCFIPADVPKRRVVLQNRNDDLIESNPMSHYKRKSPHASSSLSNISACFRRSSSSAHFSPTAPGFSAFKNRDFKSMGSIDSSDAVVDTVDPNTAKKLLDSGYAFLDVRTFEEFNEVHVATEKIVNIPYQFNSPNGTVKNDRFVEEVCAVFKKDDRIVVGCRTSGRSLRAAQDLQKNDFKHVKNLAGGIVAWVKDRLPVVRPTE